MDPDPKGGLGKAAFVWEKQGKAFIDAIINGKWNTSMVDESKRTQAWLAGTRAG